METTIINNNIISNTDNNLQAPVCVPSSADGPVHTFGKQLWNKQRDIDSFVEQGIQDLSQLKAVLKKKAQAQLKYASELHSISQSVQSYQHKKSSGKGKNGSHDASSMDGLWTALAGQLNGEADLHTKTAQFINTDLRPQIKQQKHTEIAERKQSTTQLKKLDAAFKQSHDTLANMRNQYAALCRDAEKACKLADKAKRDPDMMKEKEERLVSDAEDKLKKMDNLDGEYQQALASTNSLRLQYYTVDLPALLDAVQVRQESRIAFQQMTIEKYTQCLCGNINTETATLKQLTGAAALVSKTEDIQQFIKRTATDHSLPDPIVYENMKDPVLNRHKSDDEQFSKLAKKEAIKRAKNRLKDISKDLDAAEGMRNKLAVIAKTFVDQPALAQQGTLVETTAKLDELEHRIDTLRLKKFKYESVLNHIDKKQEPSMPVLFADTKDVKSAGTLRASVLAKMNLSSLSIDQKDLDQQQSPTGRASTLVRDETKTSTFYGSQDTTLINQNAEVPINVSPMPVLSESSTGEQQAADISPPPTTSSPVDQDEPDVQHSAAPPPPPPVPPLPIISSKSDINSTPKLNKKSDSQPELAPLVDSMITSRLNEIKEKDRIAQEQQQQQEEAVILATVKPIPEPVALSSAGKNAADKTSSIKLSSSAINYYKEIIVSGNEIQGSTSNLHKPEESGNIKGATRTTKASTGSLNSKQKKKAKRNV